MNNIVEIRAQMNAINDKYDESIKSLKTMISELESKRVEELGDLPMLYDQCITHIIEQVEEGTYEKQPGVTVKKLKTVVITDESKISDDYKKVVVDDKKIKADLKESDYTLNIEGVEVQNKYSVAVSA